MGRPFQHIEIEQSDGVCCVRLHAKPFDELGLDQLGAEIARLVDEDDCRKLVLILGPEDPQCLYSVFLGKLINVQRRIEKNGGNLALAQLSGVTRKIFQVAGLEKFFRFYDTPEDAVTAIKAA